jgi:hypothetical protein
MVHQSGKSKKGVWGTTASSFLFVRTVVLLSVLFAVSNVPVVQAHLWHEYEVPPERGSSGAPYELGLLDQPVCEPACYGWNSHVSNNGNGTWTYTWSAYKKTGLGYECHDISHVTVDTCAGSYKIENGASVSVTLPYPPGGSATGKVKTAQFCGLFSYSLPGPSCYVPCAETTDWSEWFLVQDWTWDPEKFDYFQIWERYRYDAHDLTHVCQTEPKKEWKGYQLCDEVTDWSEWVLVQDWTWDTGQFDYFQIRERYRYDVHDPTHVCQAESEKVWKGYQLCDEMTDWSEWVLVQGWTWDAEQFDYFQIWERYRYDAREPTHVCQTDSKRVWKGYQLCSEMTDWSDWVLVQDWTWDAAQSDYFQIRERYRYDAHDPTHVCQTESKKVWEGYQLCSEMTGWSEWVLVQDWTWDAEQSDYFQIWERYRYDAHDPTHVCRTESKKVQKSYQLCDETTDWVLASMGSWWWHEARQQMCRELTYVKYDAHVAGHVCYRTLELECRQPTPTPTPTPIPGFGACSYCFETLLFQSDRDGDWEICAANVDGTAQRTLTNNDAMDMAPHWAPEGGWAVFQSDRDGNWEIYRMNLDGSDQVNLSQNPAADTAPFITCRYIYFQSYRDGNWEIYRMNFDGSEQVRLTDHPGVDAQPSGSCYERVLFQSNRDGNWEIYRMNWDGSDLRRLTYTDRDEESPTWSPDGLVIFFQAKNVRGDWDLWRMDKDGRNAWSVTQSPHNDISPLWWPSCKWLFFQSDRDGSWDIYRTLVPSHRIERVTYHVAKDLIDGQVFPP